MGNHFFKFKQFTINQSKCAMKVCTDSCIFGAWVACKLQDKKVSKVLDVGTGTGLLSMMIAQKLNSCRIDALEIDNDAYEEAKENIKESIFSEQIKIANSNFLALSNSINFDAIICNPPFYENELKSTNIGRNIAMHSSHISHENLIKKVADLLEQNGSFWVLLPFKYGDSFISLCKKNNLNLASQLQIKNSEEKPPFRLVLEFSFDKNLEINNNCIVIKDSQNNYTESFETLLEPYYLYL